MRGGNGAQGAGGLDAPGVPGEYPDVTDPNSLLLLLLAVAVSVAAIVFVGQTVPRASKPPRADIPTDGLRAKLGAADWPLCLFGAGLTIWLVLALAFLAGLGAVLVQMPEALADGDRLVLLTLAALMAGLSALVALPFKLVSTGQAERQTHAQEQGFVTDRINKAVENLGAEKVRKVTEYDEESPRTREITVPNVEVRIGGLFALDRIARENLGFHVQVMQIFCAYVRQNAPASEVKKLSDFETPELDDRPDYNVVWGKWRNDYRQLLTEFLTHTNPRDDIQLAIKLIGTRNEHQLEQEAMWQAKNKGDRKSLFDIQAPKVQIDTDSWEVTGRNFRESGLEYRKRMSAAAGYRIDLRSTGLDKYDLSDLDFRGARFDGALLRDGILSGADFTGAEFSNVQMQGADLSRIVLRGATLHSAQMQLTSIRNANLDFADLGGAQLQGSFLTSSSFDGSNAPSIKAQVADFSSTSLVGITVEGAKMLGSILHKAQLQGAVLASTSLPHSRAVSADMRGADLTAARLPHVNLQDARMDRTSLAYAEMRGANIEGVSITRAKFIGTKLGSVTGAADANIARAAFQEVDLSRVGFTSKQISSAFGDGSVRLPPDLVEGQGVLAHWPTRSYETTAYIDPDGYQDAYDAWLATLPPD
jgi:uncharacterized protein YjbI with pentapeptide repeats